MANTIKFTAAGLDAIHAAYRGSSGYMAGWSNLTSASTAGTGSGMRRLIGAQDFPIAPQDTNSVVVNGDDGIMGTFLFESTNAITGTMSLGVKDITFSAAVRGETNLAVGEWTATFEDGAPTSQPALMYLVTRRALDEDSGTTGVARFQNTLWMNVATVDLGSAYSHQAAAKYDYKLTCNKSDYTPFGTTVASSSGSTYKASMTWVSTNRTMFHCWVSDGTATAITVDYTPVSTAKSKAYKISDGSALTVSSVNTSAKTITLSASPPSGTVVVVWYECSAFA